MFKQVLVACLFVVGFISVGEAQDKFNKDFIIALNVLRAENGVAPVVYDESLSDAGYLWSNILKGSGELAHAVLMTDFPNAVDMNDDGVCDYYDRAEFCGWFWGPLSENGGVMKGNINGQNAVWSWLNSPGHKANMLNPAWTHAGIGKGPWAAGRNSYFAVFGEDVIR